MSTTLERFYDGLGNVVLRDTDGTPSIFVRHCKQKSSDFDPSLPDHTHPAFVVNGVEDDAVLWGKYLSSYKTAEGPLLSLPNASPMLNAYSHYQLMAKAKLFGNGRTTEFTIADYGLLVLMMHARGIETSQGGNTMYGQSRDSGVLYRIGQSVNVGDTRVHRGYLWKCRKAHTTAVDKLPDETDTYWERIRKVGGTPVTELLSHATSMDTGSYYMAMNTLTGSGPKDWYMFGDPSLEADMCGNQWYSVSDARIMQGEIQIIPNNAGADASTGTGDTSLFKAILPHANDSGCDFVEPGTTGTVHYDVVNNKLVLINGTPSATGGGQCKFNEVTTNMSNVQVPAILYELGFAPIPGTKLNHMFGVNLSNNSGTDRLEFGQYYVFRDNSEGLYVSSPLSFRVRNNATGSYDGCRLRARELAAT